MGGHGHTSEPAPPPSQKILDFQASQRLKNFGKTEFTFPFKQTVPYHPLMDRSTKLSDPWARRENWRYHPFFKISNRIWNMVPGIGIATVAFIGYLAYDDWNMTHGPGSVEKAKWDDWMKEVFYYLFFI